MYLIKKYFSVKSQPYENPISSLAPFISSFPSQSFALRN